MFPNSGLGTPLRETLLRPPHVSGRGDSTTMRHLKKRYRARWTAQSLNRYERKMYLDNGVCRFLESVYTPPLDPLSFAGLP